MTMTTIRLDTHTRDILKRQAQEAGRTLGAHLTLLPQREEDRRLVRQMAADMAANPPDETYLREAEEWTSGPWT